MNKKILSLIIAGAMVSSSVCALAENAADENVVVTENTAVEYNEKLNQYVGTVKSVSDTAVTVAVETDSETVEVNFRINGNTPIYTAKGEKAELKEGYKVTVCSESLLLTKDIKEAKALVVNGENETISVYVDKFDKHENGLISEDGELVLNMEDAEKYEGKELLVIYDIATKSIPAQTNPMAVVVIEAEESSDDENVDNKVEYNGKTVINQYMGTVKSVSDTAVTVAVVTETGDLEVSFRINGNTPIYTAKGEKAELKEGDKVTVCSESLLLTKDIKEAKALVVNSEDGIASVYIDKFGKHENGLISEDGELVLNMEKADAEKYEGKELLVFYEIVTMSIPAQTNPTAVVVMENEDSEKKVEISFKIGNSILKINGSDVEVEKPYVVGDGTTLVPLRVISEAFGAEVVWDETTKTVLIVNGEDYIAIQIDNKKAIVNEKEQALPEAPELTENGFTMVPLRFISETFGAEVNYDGETQGVTVSM